MLDSALKAPVCNCKKCVTCRHMSRAFNTETGPTALSLKSSPPLSIPPSSSSHLPPPLYPSLLLLLQLSPFLSSSSPLLFFSPLHPSLLLLLQLYLPLPLSHYPP
ncbi:hypothetical protein NQD34_002976 [Periophthalmus magnuspinnatus]|nr:hypothetical protein NQD34_002976 [Periophthalmus magnuspinnatus]